MKVLMRAFLLHMNLAPLSGQPPLSGHYPFPRGCRIVTSDIIHPDQSYSKMYGGREHRYNEILVLTNTIQTPKRMIFDMVSVNITNVHCA